MYRRGFVIGKRGSENFGDYKLPFARVRNNRLVATRGGVIFAMASVLGARGGVDVPEDVRKRAYNFLAKYYKKFDMEAPEYKEYDPIELVINEVHNLERKEIIELVKLTLHIEAKLDALSEKVEELAKAFSSPQNNGVEPQDGPSLGEEQVRSLLEELALAKKTLGGKNDGN